MFISSCNHKIIGINYIWLSLLQGAWGIVMSIALRAELGYPGNRLIINQNLYNLSFTFHGFIMIFFLVMPVLYSGFGNYFIPIYLASPEVTYPRINSISLLLLPIAFTILCLSLVTEYGYGTGWTVYPPLSTKAQEIVLLILGLYFTGLSSVLASVNFLSTIACIKATGKLLGQMSYFVWSIIFVAILLIVTIPILTSGLLMLLADYTYCTIFYDPEFSGDPLLYQHLFWLFGHPEVYIIILPAFGIVSQILAKNLLGSTTMILAMGCIAVIGSIVWGHHMYTVGLETDSRAYFSSVSIVIAIPTGTKVFNWLSSRKERHLSEVWVALFFIITFAMGGTTGVMLANGGLDVTLHDTYYVVGHFHFVLSLGAVLGAMAASVFYIETILGHREEMIMSKVKTVVFVIGVLLTMIPMHFLGFNTHPRRVMDMPEAIHGMNHISTTGSLVSVLALLL